MWGDIVGDEGAGGDRRSRAEPEGISEGITLGLYYGFRQRRLGRG